MSNEKFIATSKAIQNLADELAIKNMLEYMHRAILSEDRELIDKAVRYHILGNARRIIEEEEKINEERNKTESFKRVLR